MVASHKISMWIAIVFVIVCSAMSGPEQGNDHVCYKTVSYKEYRNVYAYNRTYQDCLVPWFRFWCKTKVQTIYRNEFLPVTETFKRCCLGYENRSGTCRPQCVPPCVHGDCSQPNICTCNENWDGDLCDNSRVCIVRLDTAEVKSKSLSLGENVKSDQEIPECHSDCRDHGNPAQKLKESDGETYSLIPTDAPCNTAAALSIWRTRTAIMLGLLIGFLVLAFIVCAVYFVRSKRRTGDTMQHQPIHRLTELLVENSHYM